MLAWIRQRNDNLLGGFAMTVRIVHNRLLGGWFIVRGPHQTPISGRFDTKREAQESLADRKAARR